MQDYYNGLNGSTHADNPSSGMWQMGKNQRDIKALADNNTYVGKTSGTSSGVSKLAVFFAFIVSLCWLFIGEIFLISAYETFGASYTDQFPNWSTLLLTLVPISYIFYAFGRFVIGAFLVIIPYGLVGLIGASNISYGLEEMGGYTPEGFGGFIVFSIILYSFNVIAITDR